MSAEPGGIAAKLGITFERRFAIRQVLRLIRGQVSSVQWEPASGDRGGADIDVVSPDGTTEHIQLRRQNRGNAKWSVAALASGGLLEASATLLDQGPSHRFVFVSDDPVPHLKDICDQLTRSSDLPDEFIRQTCSVPPERKRAFDQLLEGWSLDPESPAHRGVAIDRLRRTSFRTENRGQRGTDEHRERLDAALTGDPDAAAGLLAGLLDENVHRVLRSQEILDFLATKGVTPRDLERDPHLPSTVAALQQRFLDAQKEGLVAGLWLARPEPQALLDAITSDAPPRLVIVHGEPGAGKSGVLYRLTTGLKDRAVTVLPLSLSVHPPKGLPHQYGESLGLNASPIAALRAVAAGGRSVLVLDQLDALRVTTPESVATWDACADLLRIAATVPDMIVVVACRTFDLKHDPRIVKWKQAQSDDPSRAHRDIEVGALTPAAIEPVLRRLTVEYEGLSRPLQQLLLNPSALEAWYRLSRAGAVRRDITSHPQLLSELIKQLRIEAVTEHPTNDADVHEIVRLARKHMEGSGSLTAPDRLFDELPTALQACCAVGLLVRRDGKLGFPHQSYFDFLVARAALNESGTSPAGIVAWVKGEQSLVSRDRVRQLLLLLRHEGPSLAASVAGALLADKAVRFHLKHLVLGLLQDADPVHPAEAELVVGLSGDPSWIDHVRGRVLWRSVPWFDALHRAGHWQRWLDLPDDSAKLVWLRVACSVMEYRPTEVDELLAPFLSSEAGIDLVGRVLSPNPDDDSPRAADLRDHQVARGRWHIHDAFLDRLAKSHPNRALRLVAAAIEGTLRRWLNASDAEERVQGIREQSVEREVAVAARSGGREAFDRFARLLRIAERVRLRSLASRDGDGSPDRLRYQRSSVILGLIQVLSELIAQVIGGAAESAPTHISALTGDRSVHRSKAVATAVAMGLSRAPAVIADAAIAWLFESEDRWALTDPSRMDDRRLAVDILAQHAGYCDGALLKALEPHILHHFPREEIEYYKWLRQHHPDHLAQGHRYGLRQYRLLAAIPEHARTPAMAERFRHWESKFQAMQEVREPEEGAGGWVTSPIPQARMTQVSDRQWRHIVAREWSDRRWKQLDADTVGEASHEQFAAAFGSRAKEEPSRFVRLMLQMAGSAPREYLTRLLDALGDQATDLSDCRQAELDSLLALVGTDASKEALRSACHLIETHHDLDWGEEAWRVLQLAARHEEPSPGQFTVRAAGEGSEARNIELTGLNSVRGAAAGAIGAFVWGNLDRARIAMPEIERLVNDPHPSVRTAAGKAVFGVYTVLPEDGVRLLLLLVGGVDDRVLAGAWIGRVIGSARWKHGPRLTPLIQRMVHSDHGEVAERGAGWATAQFLQCEGANQDLHAACLGGSESQRVGVANALCRLLVAEEVDSDAAAGVLIGLFGDPAESVRRAAGQVLRGEDTLSHPVGPRVALAYVGSPAFLDHPEALVWPLENQPLELIPFARVVLRLADRFADELADDTRSIQNRLGMAGGDLSSLLLRLYDQATKQADHELAERCLDRWDKLLERRVGYAERSLGSLPGG